MQTPSKTNRQFTDFTPGLLVALGEVVLQEEAMYELITSDAEGALLRCPDCGMEARINIQPGIDRAKAFKAIRDVRGCECPIGMGGTAAVIPGMIVYRKSDGKKFQVSDIQPRSQQIKCIDCSDNTTRWDDVCKYSKKKPGESVEEFLRKLKAGLVY